MQGMGQILAASLCVLSLLSVLADKTGTVAQSSQQADSRLPAILSDDSSSSSGSGGGDADTAEANSGSAESRLHSAAAAQQQQQQQQHTSSFFYPKHFLQASYPRPEASFPFPSGLPIPSAPSPPSAALQPFSAPYGFLQEEYSDQAGGGPTSLSDKDDGAKASAEEGPRGKSLEAESPVELEQGAAESGATVDGAHRVKRGGYRAPYFVGKRSLEESEEQVEQDELKKRSMRVAQDEGPEEVEERDETERQEEVESQDAPGGEGGDSDFPPGPSSLQQRASPMFVGKRKFAPLFVGKRRAPYFVGKREPLLLEGRAATPMFVGRSAPMFIGKKSEDDSEEDLDKRSQSSFVGKRKNPMFVGRRQSPMFVGRRQSPLFVGKRHSPMFIGKRQKPMFVGRRQSPMFIGKRRSPMFVGKRRNPMFVGKRKEDADSIHELLAALHTLREAQRYRRIIQADKRLNAPYFVGKKSDPQALDLSSAQDNEISRENEHFR